MKKVIMGVVMLAVVGIAGVVFACSTCGCQGAKANDHADADHVHAAADVAAPVNAGNKFCPIMGVAVTSDSPDKVEYNSKIYNLCCSGCAEEFLKDPEAALKKLEEKEATAK